VTNRVYQTKKTLTSIESLLLPLSLINGLLGMNFAYLTSEIETAPMAFVAGIGTMLLATLIQLYLFRRRGWI